MPKQVSASRPPTAASTVKAEGDTTLRGATTTADRIDVKTGGTLTIESLQEVAESMSKNSQVGGRVQVSLDTAK